MTPSPAISVMAVAKPTREALQAGVAPPVLQASTHNKVLEVVTLAQLQVHAAD